MIHAALATLVLLLSGCASYYYDDHYHDHYYDEPYRVDQVIHGGGSHFSVGYSSSYYYDPFWYLGPDSYLSYRYVPSYYYSPIHYPNYYDYYWHYQRPFRRGVFLAYSPRHPRFDHRRFDHPRHDRFDRHDRDERRHRPTHAQTAREAIRLSRDAQIDRSPDRSSFLSGGNRRVEKSRDRRASEATREARRLTQPRTGRVPETSRSPAVNTRTDHRSRHRNVTAPRAQQTRSRSHAADGGIPLPSTRSTVRSRYHQGSTRTSTPRTTTRTRTTRPVPAQVQPRAVPTRPTVSPRSRSNPSVPTNRGRMTQPRVVAPPRPAARAPTPRSTRPATTRSAPAPTRQPSRPASRPANRSDRQERSSDDQRRRR
ncbi:MAG: hypothetical protein R3200_14850 [Xanthomonadales bacterium]|nr:hypothetical protein [Xanthomonadales bacterium]